MSAGALHRRRAPAAPRLRGALPPRAPSRDEGAALHQRARLRARRGRQRRRGGAARRAAGARPAARCPSRSRCTACRRESYEAVSRAPGSHAECRRGLDRLARRGVPLVVKGVVLPMTLDELDEFDAWAATLPGRAGEGRHDPRRQDRVAATRSAHAPRRRGQERRHPAPATAGRRGRACSTRATRPPSERRGRRSRRASWRRPARPSSAVLPGTGVGHRPIRARVSMPGPATRPISAWTWSADDGWWSARRSPTPSTASHELRRARGRGPRVPAPLRALLPARGSASSARRSRGASTARSTRRSTTTARSPTPRPA